MNQRFLPLTYSLGIILVLAACQKQELANRHNTVESLLKANNISANSPEEKANTFYGAQVHIGDGKVRSWIRITHANVPEEIGIEMTPGALTGLPEEEHVSLVLPLHQKAIALTPFDHIGLNWNPHGHPPAMFFSAPHFDVHFYMMSLAERLAIPAYSPATDALFNTYPPAGYMPANYITAPGGDAAEPQMGKHWLPPPPSFLPFTKVMILGTYNGKFTFVEPMVTLDYLQSGVSSSQPYSQPIHFEHTGKYYPTVMNFYKDETTGKQYVTLSHFVKR